MIWNIRKKKTTNQNYKKIKASKPLTENPVGVAVAGKTHSLTGEVIGETHRVLECTQTHPPGNRYLKGHNLLVGSRGSD